MTRADRIIQVARRTLGTPYHHQGRLPGVGLDCVGLLIVVARELGLEARDVEGYAIDPPPGLLEGAVGASADPVVEPEAGDVLLLRIGGRKWAQHAGILSPAGIIHVWRGGPSKVVEHALTPQWRRRAESAWRFRRVG